MKMKKRLLITLSFVLIIAIVVFVKGCGHKGDSSDTAVENIVYATETDSVNENPILNSENGGNECKVDANAGNDGASIVDDKVSLSEKKGNQSVDLATAVAKDNSCQQDVPASDSQCGQTADTHSYVDLALTSGTLWATCNIGAKSQEEYGDYFAWGETEPKADYMWSNYKYCNGDEKHLTKYVPQEKASSCGDEGFYDNKITLELSDDVASQLWGEKWSVPTYVQQQELINECYWVWTTSYNGKYVNGYIVYKAKDDADKGKHICSGQSASSAYSVSDTHIFLPASGNRWEYGFSGVDNCGNYLSSTLTEYNPIFMRHLSFDKSGVADNYSVWRYQGVTVRPVISGKKAE